MASPYRINMDSGKKNQQSEAGTLEDLSESTINPEISKIQKGRRNPVRVLQKANNDGLIGKPAISPVIIINFSS